MTGFVLVDSAEQAFLDAYLVLTAIGGGHSLRLHTNDPTSGLTAEQIDGLAVGAFTAATFPGYAAVVVNSGWTFAQGNPTVALNTPRAFIRSSTGTPQSVLGYHLVDVSSGALRGFEQFAGPIVMEFLNDQINVTPRLTCDDVRGNEVETGTIVATGRAGTPSAGWLRCDGVAVSRTTFAALFAAIGTAYGAGDGSTTFNVPDLRQRFPLGKAFSGTGSTLGGTGGTIDHVHDLDSASSHARFDWQGNSPEGRLQIKTVTSWNTNVTVESDTALLGTVANTQGISLGGDSDPANPPYQVVNYQIKT